MRTRVAVGLATFAIAFSLFAAGLGRYRNWPNTPEGYFMTNAERAEWAKLSSEAAAETFISDFHARRSATFAADVANAARQADEHLTVANRKGSTTLRGRIVIVLGPPSTVAMSRPDGGAGAPLRQHQSMRGPSQIFQPPTELSPLSELRTKFSVDYTFTYAMSRLPGGASKDEAIVVAVNPSTGEDRILDVRMGKRVNELLEAAAAATIAK